MKKTILFLSLFATIAIAQQTISDLTVKNLKVVSTSIGSKPCPLMTGTQRDALASPLNGQCVYNTTTLKLNIYNGSVWKAAGGGVDNWATATAYAIDDLVIESNKVYQCETAHTSGTFATDLAAVKWVEISQGVTATGDLTITTNKNFVTDAQLTVIGNTSGTNTGDNSANTLYSGLATSKQDTLVSGANIKTVNSGSLLGSGDLLIGDSSNFLVNPDFEIASLADWTCTTGTCTSTTTSGEFSQGLRALKISLSAQAMDVSQSVATATGSVSQYVVGVSYKVPSTLETFQICTLIAGAEKTCVPSANLILDNLYHSIEIPEVITPGSTVGIKFKTSSDTGDAFIDKTYIKQGLGTQALQLDNVYSATVITTSGTLSNLSKSGWITSCTAANPTVCSFASGLFTVAPVCSSSPASGAGAPGIAITPTSATSVTITSFNTTSGAAQATTTANIICQKSGNDYLASSAVYSQASANTDWAACTFSTLVMTGLGTITNNSLLCRRSGADLQMMGKFTTGTVTGSTSAFLLPSNWGAITTASTIPANAVKGFFTQAAARNDTLHTIILQPSVNYFNLGGDIVSAAENPATPAAGSDLQPTTAQDMSVVSIPISGWSNSSSIVGSFENMVSTKGVSAPKLCSAQVSSTGVVSNNMGACFASATGTTDKTMTFNTNTWTVAPNCWCNYNGGTSTPANSCGVQQGGITTSSFHYSTWYNNTIISDSATVFCHGQ